MCRELIKIKIVPSNPNIKYLTFKCHLVSTKGSKTDCGLGEYWFNDCYEPAAFVLLLTNNDLVKNKNLYLPDNVLSLQCECAFSTGIAFGDIVRIDSGIIVPQLPGTGAIDKKQDDTEGTLKEDMMSLYNSSELCDMVIKTSTSSFPLILWF
ncbi:speckle-type POZ protein [Caerostris extrusa]|uniref:Speckle-type POZ protein n=1 Tax=Caerostris extrusa TaxID=172846 RepID=A0AAV4RLY4_CAEEX|nr:speckle-type POZ protein [Caerostris extrusa]